MTLDFLERGSTDDLKRLADLRCLAGEALEIAAAAGALWFATLRGSRAWIVTDRTRYVAEARRLDGQLGNTSARKAGRCQAGARGVSAGR